jgi:2-polyprenyl-6-methoxyphenol hydroxylase-like FAD-dependent oxidoreductase
MRQVEILIAGGGLAGSLAAAMLGRAGYGAIMIDPHDVYPPELRCEKLDGPQAKILNRTGIADVVLNAATADGESWIARSGRLIEKRAGDQHGILYHDFVNTVRRAIPRGVAIINAKVTAIDTSADRQHVTLSDGQEICARLVILANGLNISLRHSLGIGRDVLSPCHSVTLGFDVAPRDRVSFPFSSLTYYGERPRDRCAYISLFPIGNAMRANLMVYRDLNDPWLREFRQSPVDLLNALMPGLKRLTGELEVRGPIKIRPADLYASTGYRQPGIVLVGDAFATSCPAAGTGSGKVLTDVERLCNVHIPMWLATPGMAQSKIEAFYDDAVKRAYDHHSLTKAYHLRSLSVDDSVPWRLRRLGRSAARIALVRLRRLRALFAAWRDQRARPAQAAARLSRTG